MNRARRREFGKFLRRRPIVILGVRVSSTGKAGSRNLSTTHPDAVWGHSGGRHRAAEAGGFRRDGGSGGVSAGQTEETGTEEDRRRTSCRNRLDRRYRRSRGRGQ